jgi:hypothetical protein
MDRAWNRSISDSEDEVNGGVNNSYGTEWCSNRDAIPDTVAVSNE